LEEIARKRGTVSELVAMTFSETRTGLALKKARCAKSSNNFFSGVAAQTAQLFQSVLIGKCVAFRLELYAKRVALLRCRGDCLTSTFAAYFKNAPMLACVDCGF
jgi:hypothetical protein